jgi:hypothetical protein
MLRMTLNNIVLIDGSEFIRIYNENAPFFCLQTIQNRVAASKVDDNYITYFGYRINVKSTIFKDALSDDVLEGWDIIIRNNKHQDILGSFFELEIHNYCRYLNRLNAYIVPSLELARLCYWHSKCSKISGSDRKLLQIRREILGKSRVLIKYSKASESIAAYEDLLDTTCDFYSEMMFAVLSRLAGHNVSLNKSNDFVVDNNIAEVKSIHDKFDVNKSDPNSSPFLQMSLPDPFTIADLKDMISGQVRRGKWISHLKKAIQKQKGKIIFFNATHSQGLYYVSNFLEEKQLRKGYDAMLNASLSFVNNNDSMPVLVMLENIHEHHKTTFFCFLVPIKNKDSNQELDLSRYSHDYVKNNIFL